MDQFQAQVNKYIANAKPELAYTYLMANVGEVMKNQSSDKSLAFLFLVTSYIVLPAWILIALLPKSKLTRYSVTFALFSTCAIYTFTILPELLKSSFNSSDFTTFKGVVSVFRTGAKPLVLSAWIHYFAMDLICGYYIARDAANSKINRLLILPYLFATLMLAPFGFLLWTVTRKFLGARGNVLSFDLTAGNKIQRNGLKVQ